MHTRSSRFCTVNHQASVSNYKLSNMKCPGRDSNLLPQRLKASTLTATPPGGGACQKQKYLIIKQKKIIIITWKEFLKLLWFEIQYQ